MYISHTKNTQNKDIKFEVQGMHIHEGEVLQHEQLKSSELDPRLLTVIAAIKEAFAPMGSIEIAFNISIKETPP